MANLDYIARMLNELRNLSNMEKLPFLTYLVDMAATEAEEEVARRNAPAKPKSSIASFLYPLT